MKVVGLDGRQYTWNLADKGSRATASAPHKRARKLLAELFGSEPRLEEVRPPGSGQLFFDFFLPRSGIVVEVNGEQHDRYSSFFHKSRLGFLQSTARDNKKQSFCEANMLRLVILPEKET